MPLTCVISGCNSKQVLKKGVTKACHKEKNFYIINYTMN